MVADLTGDEHPEIIIRSGHIFPGTGTEKLYILDYTATPLPGWPIETPTPDDHGVLNTFRAPG